MSPAAGLLLYGLTMVIVAPPLLARLTRGGHAPRLGVAAWLTAIGSVLISWAVAAALFVVDATSQWNHRGLFVASCCAWLRGVVTGGVELAAQVTALVLAAVVAAAAAVIGARLARTLRRLRVRAHDHARAVRLVGRGTAEHDVVRVDAAKPAAYCVSGRPPAIVVTTGALAALDERQLGAVLAHERAHLAGRHPNVVAALRGLAIVFPRLTLMTRATAEVSRLLEMCADDVAARRHGNEALVSGLIALAGGAPAGALAAADVAVLTRAQRLTAPAADRVRLRARAALTGAVTMMVAGPLIAVAFFGVAGALMCGA